MENVYTGREFSWLSFNERVLNEALDQDNPLLEQLRFLSIFASNLDEYFMIRVSGIYSQTKMRYTEPDVKSGLLPRAYLQLILKQIQTQVKLQYKIYHEKMNEINQYLHIQTYDSLTEHQKEKMTQYFHSFIYPVLTPIRFSQYLPFPLLPNLSVYMISRLKDKNQSDAYSVVTVPSNIKRLVKVKKDTYILLEDLIIAHMQDIYKGIEVLETYPFRITRDFDIEFSDHSDDFAVSVSRELKNRKRGVAVRLEIKKNVSDEIIHFLNKHLKLPKKHVFFIEGPLDLTYLNEVYDLAKDMVKGLVYETITLVEPRVFKRNSSYMQVMEKRDVLLLHPHHTYEPVVGLVQEAASDPDVVAIKQTIYRTTRDSRIMRALVKAADNGKQVTVLFELKARFDEENNLYWGGQLERAGAHVIYGVPNLKTHSKLLLIVKNMAHGVQEFVHFSTGNYNERNAKVYTDVSFFTSDKVIGHDVVQFFNYISSYAKKPQFNKLIASPNSIKRVFLERLDQEIKHQEAHGDGYVIVKCNAITDTEIMDKMVEASQKGVKIDIISRSITCLIPGVKGYTENISVRSIVGRYLEHMRLFYFFDHGREFVLISSADLMTRNMERRIETALPVEDLKAKQLLISLLKLQLKDNVKTYIFENDAFIKYHNDLEKVNSQLALYQYIK